MGHDTSYSIRLWCRLIHKTAISGTSLPLTKPSVWVPSRAGDVDFIRPERGEQCWWVKEPCTPPDEPLRPLKFRDPSVGHSKGYEPDRRNEAP